MEIIIPSLTPWQQSAISRATQRNIVNAGRQAGKSTLIIERVYERIVKHQRIALLFPTYKSLWSHWARIINTFYPAISNKNESRMTIEFTGGATLECFSGESADNMRGNQFDEVIIDEAAHIARLQDIVESIILPTLLARAGTLWMLSTPKGTTGYFNECKESGLWTVTQATSYDNPYLDANEIDKMKLTMAPDKVQQELMGIPVDEHALTPFFYSYDAELHFRQDVMRNPRMPLYFSFDFNVALQSCVVAQFTGDNKLEVLQLIQLKNSSVEAMCELLRSNFPDTLRSGNYKIVGDASGNNRSGYYTGNISFYGLIKQKLQARDYNMRFHSFNLGHAQSQQLCNAIINVGLVTVSSPELNRQIRALTVTDTGIVKDGNDHGTDCFRYVLHAIYVDFLTKPYKYLPVAKRQLPVDSKPLPIGKYSR